MTQSVYLEPAEWQQVITALAMSNPVLVKISSQLAAQQRELVQGNAAVHVPGNSGIPHPSEESRP